MRAVATAVTTTDKNVTLVVALLGRSTGVMFGAKPAPNSLIVRKHESRHIASTAACILSTMI